MSEDPISSRFKKKQKKHEFDERAKKTRSIEDIQDEEKLIKNTEKVEPIKGGKTPKRNDPCHCGSGKKYKKCCGRAA